MAATVIINEKNGAGETATDKTSGTIRFKNADDASVNLSDPMVIPTSGSDWSYEKWARLNVSGTFTQIENLKAYTDGSNGLGTGVNAWYKTASSYSTPSQPTSSSGLTDLFTATSGSPINLGNGPYTSAGDIGSYLVMSLEVQSTASSGVTPSETLTFSYDEI